MRGTLFFRGPGLIGPLRGQRLDPFHLRMYPEVVLLLADQGLVQQFDLSLKVHQCRFDAHQSIFIAHGSLCSC